MKRTLLSLILVVGLSTSAWADLRKIKNCGSSKDDIKEAAAFIDSNWSSFERSVERGAGVKIRRCLKNRFKKNGKVVCEKSNRRRCKGNNGWASFLSRKTHMCPTFLNRVRSISGENNRKACYMALMTHEFGHTCWRAHRTVEPMDDAAFAWAKSNLAGVSIDLINCGMD